MNVKLVVCLASMLIGGSAIAQEFKYKKGVLSLDANPIAKVTDKRGVYTFSNLEGQEVVKIKMKSEDQTIYSRIIYYEVSLPDDSKKINIVNKSDKKTLSGEKKMFWDFGQGDFKLLTANGIDLPVLDQVFLSDQTELNKQLEVIGEARKAAQDMKKYYENTGLNFNMAGDIGKGSNTNFTKMGHLYRKEVSYGHNTYELINDGGKSVAFWNKDGDYMLRLSNGNSYLIPPSYSSVSSGMNMDDLAKIIVGHAVKADLL